MFRAADVETALGGVDFLEPGREFVLFLFDLLLEDLGFACVDVRVAQLSDSPPLIPAPHDPTFQAVPDLLEHLLLLDLGRIQLLKLLARLLHIILRILQRRLELHNRMPVLFQRLGELLDLGLQMLEVFREANVLFFCLGELFLGFQGFFAEGFVLFFHDFEFGFGFGDGFLEAAVLFLFGGEGFFHCRLWVE